MLLACAAVSLCGPLPQKTGSIVHHHHAHRERYLMVRGDSSLTSALKSTLASSSLSSLSVSSQQSQLSTLLSLMSSTTSSVDSSVTSTLPSVTSSSTAAMPKVTKTSSTASESYSYTIIVPPSLETGSYQKNPYVVNSLAPDNIVFVAVGAVVGAIFLAAIAVRIVSWCISRRKAKTDREVYFHNFSHKFSPGTSEESASFLLGTSSSSILEKSSNSSNMLDRLSLNWDVSGQGRTYRDMLAKMERRGSMTIGPVLELIMASSRSNVDLPMLHPQETGLRMLFNAPSVLDMPVYADLVGSRTDSRPDSRNDIRTDSRKESRRERPPSQLLDDLLDGVDVTLDPGTRPL